MSTQASLDVAVNDTIDPAWGDEVRAHLVTTETGTPSLVHEGKLFVRTDLDELEIHNGSTVQPFGRYGQWDSVSSGSLSASQGGLVTTSSVSCDYVRLGRLVFVTFSFGFSGGSAAPSGQAIRVNLGISSSLPTARRTGYTVGTFSYRDDGTGFYAGAIQIEVTTYNLVFYRDGDGGLFGASGTPILAANDSITGSFFYEGTS